MCVGAGVWKLRSALDTIRKDNLTEVDVQDFAGDLAWSNRLLKFAKFNPGVQMLRVVPGISWAPQAFSAGSQVVSEIHSILDHGGNTILEIAFSGDLTPKPGLIDVSAASEVAIRAGAIAERMERLQNSIETMRDLKIPGIGHDRINELVEQGVEYVELAESALVAMKELPQLIGNEDPMNYFVGITNEAELRGIQGIIGEYAIVQVNDGQISVSRTGSNTDLIDPKSLASELQGAYADIYGSSNTEWQNVNLSPFMDSSSAQITHAWKVQTGQTLDGVILLDTVALAKWAIPKIGSVETAQGRELNTWESLADYLSNGIYFDFPNDQFARKQFQSEIASRLIESITGSSLDPKQLVRNLAQPMIAGRVNVWLNGDVGSNFNNTFLARSINSFPQDVVLGINNWTGNKMDFYLYPKVGWRDCDTLALSLESKAESGVDYPDYFTRRLDSDSVEIAPLGSFLDVNLALPKGVGLGSVAENNAQVEFDEYPIGGNRTIVRTSIEILAGSRVDLVFNLDSGRVCKSHAIRVSPMMQDLVALDS